MKQITKSLVLLSLLSITVVANASASAQEPSLVPGENLVVEGIPNIPASLVQELSVYKRARAADILGWHPVKREMLIVTSFAGTPQIHLVKFPGGARTQLTFFDDRPTSGVSYQPTNGNYFIFRKDTDGNRNFQIYRYDFSSGAVTLLTDGKSRNSAAVWSNAGNQIAYASSRRNGRDADLYVVDPLNPQNTRMLAQLQGGVWNALDWSPDDRQILVRETISINESYLWLFDVTGGKQTLITPKGEAEKTYYGDARFRKDGKGAYVITDRGSEFKRLAFLNFANRQYEFLTSHIKWDVTEFKPSPDGRMLALVTNEEGMTVLHLLNAYTRKEKPLALPPGAVIGIYWRANSRELGYSSDSARFPADAYSLDVATGKVERWTFSETGLNTANFAEPELIRWKSFDGRMISGFLYRPPARFTGKRPVMIWIHGGPEDQFQPYFLGPQNYYLNELGVALLFPNIRGSSGFGKSFLKLDNGLLREDAYKDIGALLDWIKTSSDLDSERVMVSGFSYGGNVALVTATQYADRIRGAIDVVGPSNLVTFLERTAGYRQDLRRAEYGDERDAATRSLLERVAPLNNAERIKKPLFVIQGENDPAVPFSQSEEMVAAVKKNGIPVWYLKAKDEGHGFTKKSNRDYQMYATVQFVKEYLLK